MAKYLAQRIYDGKLSYNAVIKKYPKLKDEIDSYLRDLGYDF